MLKNIVFLLLISLESVLVHYLIFTQTDFLSLSTFLIWLESFLFFGFIFTFRPWVWGVTLTVESLFFLLLLAYHHYYVEPITFGAVIDQAREGLIFAAKSPSSFLKMTNFEILLIFALKLFYALRYYQPLPKLKLIRFVTFVPLVVLLSMSFTFFYKTTFLKRDFNAIAADFGYVQAWGYEFMTSFDRARLIKEVVVSSNQSLITLSEELQFAKLPNNIYIIQLESIDYAALKGKVNEKALMPFLNNLAQKSQFYQIHPHDKQSSANSDFSVLTGSGIYGEMYNTTYNLIPIDSYKKMYTIPKAVKQKGYTSHFYHGFVGTFFKRKEHIKAMEFDQNWFLEDMPSNKHEGAWGWDDAELFDFVTQKTAQSKNSKNFNFIITVSSHEDFQIGKSHNKIIKHPQTIEELFYNAANYVDGALEQFITKAPKDSLFVIYSDHHSNIMDDRRTFMIIYNQAESQPPSTHEVSFESVPKILKSMLAQ